MILPHPTITKPDLSWLRSGRVLLKNLASFNLMRTSRMYAQIRCKWNFHNIKSFWNFPLLSSSQLNGQGLQSNCATLNCVELSGTFYPKILNVIEALNGPVFSNFEFWVRDKVSFKSRQIKIALRASSRGWWQQLSSKIDHIHNDINVSKGHRILFGLHHHPLKTTVFYKGVSKLYYNLSPA